MWLLKCTIGPVTEPSSAVNVLTGPKHCWNLNESRFILLFDHFEISWVKKTSLLGRSDILGLFFNTLTADDKDSRRNRDNLPQQIQMLLLQKPKTFYQYLVVSLKPT